MLHLGCLRNVSSLIPPVLCTLQAMCYGETLGQDPPCALSWEPVFFFCCSVSFVVGSLKDEPGRRVSE